MELYFYSSVGKRQEPKKETVELLILFDKRKIFAQEYEYDSFGNMKDRKNKVKQPYAFTGREWDREAKLYYYRARYYEPNVGRFISFDPILRGVGNLEGTGCSQTVSSLPLQGPQELNPFVYVGNNPGNRKDPTGLAWYGNWCGPGGSGTPINCYDIACKEHDECYGRCGVDWLKRFYPENIRGECAKACDKTLLKKWKDCACSNGAS